MIDPHAHAAVVRKNWASYLAWAAHPSTCESTRRSLSPIVVILDVEAVRLTAVAREQARAVAKAAA